MTTRPKSTALRAFLDQQAEKTEEERSIVSFMRHQLRRSVPGGRPRLKLPPIAACSILAALESGHSKKEVARVFGGHYSFSVRWLYLAVRDGRLADWAAACRCPRHGEPPRCTS